MLVARLLGAVAILGVVAKFALPVNVPLGYRTEINRLNALQAPYTGALVIRVNANGVINGTFESDSVRPDPAYGQFIPVNGSIDGSRIRLDIGTGTRAISINGTLRGSEITGSAMMSGGGLWTFRAVRVHLRNPPQKT